MSETEEVMNGIERAAQVFEEILQKRMEVHRALIRERAEWIKSQSIQGRQEAGEDVTRTAEEMRAYHRKRERWEEQVQTAHDKMDEIRRIASDSGLEL